MSAAARTPGPCFMGRSCPFRSAGGSPALRNHTLARCDAAPVLSAFSAQPLAPLRPSAAFRSSCGAAGAEKKNTNEQPCNAWKPGNLRERGKTGGAGKGDGMIPLRTTRVALAAAALLLLGPAGCMSFLHPVDRPAPEQLACCEQLPTACRQQVYVFFIHGVDPLDYANLSGVRDYVQ